MSIEQKQAEIIKIFNDMGDIFDQYAYLIEISGQLPLIEQEMKIKENLVQGCQSKVWLHICFKDGFADIKADSDTLIIKGILKLIADIFNGETAKDIINSEMFFLNKLDVANGFTTDRKKGITYILTKITKISQGCIEISNK